MTDKATARQERCTFNVGLTPGQTCRFCGYAAPGVAPRVTAAAESAREIEERIVSPLRDALGELHDAVGAIVFRDVEERTEVVSPRETIYRATRAMVRAADVLGESYRAAFRDEESETPGSER